MKFSKLPLLAVSCLALVNPAKALDFDFSGTFTQDNNVVSLFFSVGAASTVTVFSSSWDDGGFDPILAIWDLAGNKLAEQDDGLTVGSTSSNAVSYTHGTWDSYYQVNLAAGTYRATIAQYNNFSVSNQFSDGFIHDGNPNFTFDNNFGGATQPFFNGVWDNNDPRTGNWAFHILNVEQASQAPDATSSLGLMGLALAALAAVRRRFVR